MKNTPNMKIAIVGVSRDCFPAAFPGVLVASHDPFTWGGTAGAAVDSAVALEFLARLASETLDIAPATKGVPQILLDKHFLRKHGSGAYYGQN